MDAPMHLEPKLHEFATVVQSLCDRVDQRGDRPDLREVEMTLRRALQALGHAAIQVVLERYGNGRTSNSRPCSCGGRQRYKHTALKEMTDLQGGVLRFERAYYYCASCQQGFLPLDEQLGLGREEMTPALAEVVQLLGVIAPFEEAARVAEHTLGIELSKDRVRRATEQAGQRCLRADSAEAEHALAIPPTTHGAGEPPQRTTVAERHYVMADGGMVRTDEGWREVKLGVCFRAADIVQLSQQRTEVLRKRFFGDLLPADEFGKRLYAATRRENLAPDGAGCDVISDAAEWIANVAAEHLPRAQCWIDWYHVKERIWSVANLLYGEGSTSAARWAEARCDELWNERPQAVLLSLRRVRPRREEASTAVAETIRYIEKNHTRMHYASRHKLGLLVGSGAIEGGIKYVLQARHKRAGMRWSEEGARAVLALRLRWVNGEWQARDARPTANALRALAVA